MDVGYGQLAWSLQSDERVTVKDRTNVRELTLEAMDGEPVDLVVGDLSFIPLGLVLPALVRCAAPDADLVMMVKPQFEVGKERLGSGGVVRSPELRAEAVARGVARRAAELGLGVKGVTASPLPGPSGNVEYFLWLRAGAPELDPADVDRAVAEEGPRFDTDPSSYVFLLAHTGRPAAIRSAELVHPGCCAPGSGCACWRRRRPICRCRPRWSW